MLLLYVNGYVEVMLKETGIIGHGNKNYCKANKRSCDELIDEHTEYTKRLDFLNHRKRKNTTCYVLDS